MAEDTTTSTTSPADASGTNLTAQAADTTTSTTSPADASQNKPSKTPEDYERMLAELRKENAGHRTKLKKFEDDAKSREEAQLSKEQLLEKQYNDLKAQHDSYVEAQFEQSVRSAISMEAAKQGVDPNVLHRVANLIDWEQIDVDDEGQATNIADLVAQVVKDMPMLKTRNAPTSGGATNPARSQSSAPQALSWDVLGKMAPDEYNQRRAEIQQWMLNNPPRFR